ncbi:MAG TPA: hypothetical protein VM536_08330 [Chloroflexia bacterium]|nr:hypothetical protein [Chloroflexia bacterium]
MPHARVCVYGVSVAVGSLLLAAVLFLTAGAAQAAPPSDPGHGQGQGQSRAIEHGQGKQGPGGGPAVVWATHQITTTLAPGASLDQTATFTVTRALSNVRVGVVPGHNAAITVTPASFASLVPGQTYTVRIHLAVPAGARRGAYTGHLQMRTGHRVLSRPLGIHIRVPRAQP